MDNYTLLRWLDRELPGIPELIRAQGFAGGQPLAAISRGLAGVSGRTLVVNLPGSRGGVRDAIDVLGPILDHVVEQLAGALDDLAIGASEHG